MQINVEIDPRVINEVYRPYLDDPTHTQIFFGGSSSGKSRFLAQRQVYDLLNGGRNFLNVRNTGRTHKVSTHNEICKVITDWGVSHLFNTPKSELTITCVNDYQSLFIGLDDVEKAKSITPIKGDLTDIWVEEATETGEDDNKQLTKRLRGLSKAPKRITYSFNPILRTNWLFKTHFTGWADNDTVYRDPELSILKTTYKDNRFLTAQDAHFLESETNKYYYDVYTLGNWGVLGHLIFTNYRIEDLTGLRDSFGTYDNGLDFGYTNDPTALARCATQGKILYITHELYEYGLLNNQIAELTLPITGRHDPIRCDPGDPKSIAELRGYGLNTVAARGGPGSVNHGIQYIQQFEVVIDRTCQNAINEVQAYQWDVNKNGEVLNTPVDRDNHFIDALRYSLSGKSFAAPKTDKGKFDRRLLGLPG